jgi:hypothetical protein
MSLQKKRTISNSLFPGGISNKKYDWLLLSMLLGAFFLLSTHAIPEGDTFWHIKSGEYIWQHKSLPEGDPFGFVGEIDPWKNVTLTGFWLSQVGYHLIFSEANTAGIILLRAVTITLILLFQYYWMRKNGVKSNLTIPFLLLVGFYLKDIGDRPQNFSFLFFAITAFSLESLRTDESPLFRARWLVLPALMLLWPNIHGGFVMGAVLIVIYLIGELFRFYREPARGFCVRRNGALYVISLGLTFCNPNTYHWHLYAWKLRNDYHTAFVQEYFSPMQAALLGKIHHTYWILIVFTVIVLVLTIKKIALEKFAVLLFVGLFSLKYQRGIPFFLMLTPLTALEFNNWVADRWKRVFKVLSVSCIVLLFLFVLRDKSSIFDRSLSDKFPVEAVKFMNEVKPTGRVFHFSDWGGYLMVYAPEYKVFHDNRFLSNRMLFFHHAILMGENWKKFLTDYQFDIILIPTTMPVSNKLFPLVFELFKDNGWHLVYKDKTAFIYLRSGRNNDMIIEKYMLPKNPVLLSY